MKLEPDCDLPQTFIPRNMAKPVIDRFEVVEIDERESRNRDLAKVVLAEFVVAFLEYTSIGQSRQGITLGELPETFPKLFFVSDILFRAEDTNGPSMLERDIGHQAHPSVDAAARLNASIEHKAAAASDGLRTHPLHLLPGLVII